ncbi:MAG: hypothetical protein IIC39_00505 [Candidatus Marinimicrobia bacterium]|nr:hypothetical protein [Candidatus Neomarinimicrobiota bacterium]
MERHHKLHIIYNAIFFGLVIIILATINFGSIPKFVEYFVFGLTLTSIALAVIVIIYTFFTNNQMTSSSQTIKDTVSRLYEKIDLLPPKIDRVGSSVDEVISSVKSLKQGYSKDSFIADDAEQTPDATTLEAPVVSDKFFDTNASRMSDWGIATLYICIVAFDKQKAFSRTELAEKFDYSQITMHGDG